MSEAITTQKATLKGILTSDAMKSQFTAALPRHLSVDRFCRIAITALTRTPRLLECTQESLFKCLLDLSAMGLEPDGIRAHLIPHRNNKSRTTECTLIVDYKGIVELVRRDPEVVDVQCITIRENDTCLVENGQIAHRYSPLGDRGKVVAVYTRVVWKSGHVSFGEPVTRDDAEEIRKRSKSPNDGPWVTDFVEMWKKTALRRDSKMWPLSPEVREFEREEPLSLSIDREVSFKKESLPEASTSELTLPEEALEPKKVAEMNPAWVDDEKEEQE